MYTLSSDKYAVFLNNATRKFFALKVQFKEHFHKLDHQGSKIGPGSCLYWTRQLPILDQAVAYIGPGSCLN